MLNLQLSVTVSISHNNELTYTKLFITCYSYATSRKYLETSFWRFQPICNTRMKFWFIAVTI